MFSSENFNVLESSDTTTANFLQQLLINAKEIKKPSINFSGEVTTKLDFPRNWGFGSSSTLISCVAQWFIIDPFKLHFSISNGSGYDIACANSKSAITYSINNKTPLIHSISWKPSFNESLFFVHLNNKQNSANEVAKYQSQQKDNAHKINLISIPGPSALIAAISVSGFSSKPPPTITNFSLSLAKFTKTFAAMTGSFDEPMAVGPQNISSMC